MGKLALCSFPGDTITHGNKKRKVESYMFDHRSVCQTASMLFHALSIRVLKALQHQLKEYGPTPHTHKLKGKVVYDKSYSNHEHKAHLI